MTKISDTDFENNFRSANDDICHRITDSQDPYWKGFNAGLQVALQVVHQLEGAWRGKCAYQDGWDEWIKYRDSLEE
jgi:hypothetical protein